MGAQHQLSRRWWLGQRCAIAQRSMLAAVMSLIDLTFLRSGSWSYLSDKVQSWYPGGHVENLHPEGEQRSM
jgi:hypothetical protein